MNSQHHYPNPRYWNPAHEELCRALDAAPRVSAARILAWDTYRTNEFRAQGREGLGGPYAVYHFQDTAQTLMRAAFTLRDPCYAHDAERDRYAINQLENALGWRYMRGAEGLRDLLASEGKRQASAEALAECGEFASKFASHLQAAHDAGEFEASTRRPLIVSAIRAFAYELMNVADWLEDTRQASLGPLVRADARWALDELDRQVSHAQECADEKARIQAYRASKRRR